MTRFALRLLQFEPDTTGTFYLKVVSKNTDESKANADESLDECRRIINFFFDSRKSDT